MPSQSLQHTLDRVRPPRVQITYDVETGGAMQRVELPFVVGVLADLSGQPAEPNKPLKERKFVTIDRDNINEVLRRSKARIAVNVPNRISNDDSKLPVALTFESLEDFEPASIVRKIEVLAKLLKTRDGLMHVLGKMEGNDRLEAELASVIGDASKTKALAEALGVKPRVPQAPTGAEAAGATAGTSATAPDASNQANDQSPSKAEEGK